MLVLRHSNEMWLLRCSNEMMRSPEPALPDGEGGSPSLRCRVQSRSSTARSRRIWSPWFCCYIQTIAADRRDRRRVTRIVPGHGPVSGSVRWARLIFTSRRTWVGRPLFAKPPPETLDPLAENRLSVCPSLYLSCRRLPCSLFIPLHFVSCPLPHK